MQLKWLISGVFTFLLINPLAAQSGEDFDPVKNLQVHIIKICDSGNWQEFDNPTYTTCEDDSVWAVRDDAESNEVEILLTAYVVDLVGKDENIPSDPIAFPARYPRPYMRYEYSPGVFEYTNELVNWTFQSKISVLGGPVHNLFSASVFVTMQLPDGDTCEPGISTVDFTRDVRLSTYSDKADGKIDYPILSYGSADEIFSCDIFNDTKDICNGETLNSDDILTLVDICLPCHIIHQDNPGARNSSIAENAGIKMLSNPFSESINFDYESKKSSSLKVALHSFDGQLILDNSYETNIGKNRIQIPTENFTSGIYYLSIFDGDEKSVQKVVCVK